MGMSGRRHGPAVLPPRKRVLHTNCIGVWVDSTTGLDVVEQRILLTPVGDQTPGVQPVARRYTD
jgi:hypothetical protein